MHMQRKKTTLNWTGTDMSLWYIPRGTCEEKIGDNWPEYTDYMKAMEGKVWNKLGIQTGQKDCIVLDGYCFPEEYIIKVAD